MNTDNLKYLREEKCLTQSEIARDLNITRAAYSLWEINKNTIPLTQLNKLSNYFNVSMDYIIGISNIKKNDNPCNEIDKVILGKKLKQTRKELHYTQEKLANILNTTHSAISAYENGITIIPTLFLLKISQLSKKSLSWFCSNNE